VISLGDSLPEVSLLERSSGAEARPSRMALPAFSLAQGAIAAIAWGKGCSRLAPHVARSWTTRGRVVLTGALGQ